MATERTPGAGTAVPTLPAEAGEYISALIDALPEATIFVVDREERVRFAEGTLLHRHGMKPAAMLDRCLADILPAATSTTLRERYRQCLEGSPQTFDYRTVDGLTRCLVELRPIRAGEQKPVAVVAVVHDVTQRYELASELTSERERRVLAEDFGGIGHWELDVRSGRVRLSEGASRLLERESPDELALAQVLSYIDEADREAVSKALLSAIRTGNGECECRVHGDRGAQRQVLLRGVRTADVERPETLVGTAIDITQLRLAEDSRAEFEALFREGFDNAPIGMTLTDPLTGRYLRVNDAFCWLLGRTREELLEMTVAEVTEPEDRSKDGCGRQDMIAGNRESFEFEKRYLARDGRGIWVSLHITPVHDRTGNVRAFFSQVVDLTERKAREVALMREAADLERLAEIRAALQADRFVLHQQPIVTTEGEAVVQRELLVRMIDESGDMLAPAQFLPVAERFGCMTEIDRWVVSRAVGLAATGQSVAVNLSAASVGDVEMLTAIRELLEASGADPALIVFEITETALMADLERGRVFANSLRDLGCRFALDDFGTGYGTLTYLKHLPIDFVKIDREFVRDLLESETDRRVVRTIISMAQSFGIQTIAEGVEDAATLDCLRDLGADHAQGFHIARPCAV